MYFDKLMGKVRKDIAEFAKSYSVSESAVVWIGNNHYIIVKDGTEIGNGFEYGIIGMRAM